MAADVKKGEKWSFNRSGGQIKVSGYYTVKYDPGDYASVESEVFHASYESGVPAYSSVYPTDDLLLYLNEKHVTTLGPHYFKVNITYTNGIRTKNNQTVPVNPTLQPAEISYFTITTSKKIDRAVNPAAPSDRDKDLPITNSAKETYDPPVMEDDIDIGMRIVKYYSSYNPLTQWDYNRTVNQDVFQGIPAGKVRFKEESAEEVEIGTTTYWKVTRTCHIRKDGWNIRMLDEGFRVIKGSNVLPKEEGTQIEDSKENKISEPALLDGAGGLLAAGADAVFNEHQVCTLKDYSGLV